jgi:hypothetical protein
MKVLKKLIIMGLLRKVQSFTAAARANISMSSNIIPKLVSSFDHVL